MTDQPWEGDACGLVDAYRRGERSPHEELEASLAAIERSDLNAFTFLDADRAMDAVAHADVSKPFGGVPVGVKELDFVAGWPATEASLIFKDRISGHTSTMVTRLLDAGGAIPVGLTAASEFGGLNVSVSKLNGVTHNPWRHGRTAGGSSGGSASAVAGGLVTIATGGDGGGSIRIPAGYTGLVGMKGTYGRIPRGPNVFFRPGTVVVGCLARSARDAARYFDVSAGFDVHDPTSLPATGGWEGGLGTRDLAGRKVAVIPALAGVTLEPGVEAQLHESAAALIAAAGMIQVDLRLELPNLAAQWMMGNLATLLAELGDAWPGRADELTDEVATGLLLSQSMYNLYTASVAEAQRVRAYEAMANAFEDVDFIIAATNPGPAFAADSPMSSSSGGFVEWAGSSKVARPRLPGDHGRSPRRGRRVSEVAVGDPRYRSRAVPRSRAHGRADDHLQHLRQPRGLDPRWVGRRSPRRDAGAGPAPRRRAAVRRRARRRARAPMAEDRAARRGSTSPGVRPFGRPVAVNEQSPTKRGLRVRFRREGRGGDGARRRDGHGAVP